MRAFIIAASVGLSIHGTAFAAGAAETATPTLEDLQKQINAQQARIDQLERRTEAAVLPQTSATTLGGYGELHYSNLDSGADIDFTRFVLFVGHDFDERTRLVSELEVEHVFIEGGEGGEVAVEQAFVERDWNNRWKSRFGVFLMPVGIINEHHEPPVFYGVERNPVEHDIIPATWSEGGVQTIGNFGSLQLDLAVSGGLGVSNSDPGEEYLVREARLNASEAAAESPAYTARLKWRGLPGVELAATVVYQDDAGQEALANVGAGTMAEAHAIWRIGGADLRALYARYTLDGDGPKALDRDVQEGGYLEASYRMLPTLGVFARYNSWDNGGSGDTLMRQTNVGLNYWLTPDVVLKADGQWQGGAGSDDGFNLGFGYQF